MAFTLCGQDPLCVVEQSTFDRLCSIARRFEDLPHHGHRSSLLDALCSSFACLVARIDKDLASCEEEAIVSQYRSAFKAYIFFLQWVSSKCIKESRQAVSESLPAATKGRGKKKISANEWDWPLQFSKIVKVAGQALSIDLWTLFRPSRPDQTMLLKLIQLCSAALAMPEAVKDEELAGCAGHALAALAITYRQMDQVVAALVDAINSYEHTPALVADILRHSVAHWDDTTLATAVVADIASVEPSEYERQQNATGEKAGVRSVGVFVEELSSKLPRFMAQQISLLLPHLAGKAWTLRSSIVTALGFLLHKAFEVGSHADAESADAHAARLKTKQHLLDILCRRIRDQSSFVRKAVLQTWQYLATNRAVPLGHWLLVTTVATGRLEDKSSLVRKEALRLLAALMLHNPFGPALPIDRFSATLQVHKAMLEQLDEEEDGTMTGNNETGNNDNIMVEADGQDENVKMEIDSDVGPVKTQVENEIDTKINVAAVRKRRTPADVGWDGTLEELQALVASLELAVDFTNTLSDSMPTLLQLLASATVSDVQESIALLLTCKQFEVAGAPDAIRKILPLVFSRDQAIKDRIIDALDHLYISGWAGNTFTSAEAASNLVRLAMGATLGELASLEEVIKECMLPSRKLITPLILHEVWMIAEKASAHAHAHAHGQNNTSNGSDESNALDLANTTDNKKNMARIVAAALAVLSATASCSPDSFADPKYVSAFVRLGFGVGYRRHEEESGCITGGGECNALAARHAGAALRRLGPILMSWSKAGYHSKELEDVYAVLIGTVVGGCDATNTFGRDWYSVAESSLSALYQIHPAPHAVAAGIIRNLASKTFTTRRNSENGGEGRLDRIPSVPLSHFFFVLGHVALSHLVMTERVTKAVRRARVEAELKRGESFRGNGEGKGEKKDFAAELGVGSAAADAELDAMKEASEGQILGEGSLLAPYARVVESYCRHSSLVSAPQELKSSALLALVKLMTVDARVCEANLQLVFTLLQNHSRLVEAPLRCNLVIALGDLALRFPNIVEPWTGHMYAALGDPEVKVRKTALMVLSHLILNDMMKVKGHISKVAMCLEDDDQRISALAQLFFDELSKKETQRGVSPVYNLLPDILSNLAKEPTLSRNGFRSIMTRLLGYVKKDKQGDALVEKLCQRFAAANQSGDPAQWRNTAFCLSQLPIGDKGLRKLAESFASFKAALADGETAEMITAVVNAGLTATTKPETKALLEGLRAKMVAEERALKGLPDDCEDADGGTEVDDTEEGCCPTTDNGNISTYGNINTSTVTKTNNEEDLQSDSHGHRVSKKQVTTGSKIDFDTADDKENDEDKLSQHVASLKLSEDTVVPDEKSRRSRRVRR